MNDNQLKGAAQQVAGRIQDAVGALGADRETQLAGKARQTAGKIQGNVGDIEEQAWDLSAEIGWRVQQYPIAAVLIAVGAGFLLGRISRR